MFEWVLHNQLVQLRLARDPFDGHSKIHPLMLGFLSYKAPTSLPTVLNHMHLTLVHALFALCHTVLPSLPQADTPEILPDLSLSEPLNPEAFPLLIIIESHGTERHRLRGEWLRVDLSPLNVLSFLMVREML